MRTWEEQRAYENHRTWEEEKAYVNARARRKRATRPQVRIARLVSSHNSRALRKGDAHRLTAADVEWMYATYGTNCLACDSPDKPTIDHVVPYALGGTNTRDNIQPLCLPCNNQKARHVIDYRREIRPFGG
jgi:5-methylcytosine-specific restriction endonuclease McrA